MVSAIRSESYESVMDELGDVLLHVTMLSEIAQEKQLFDLEKVAKAVSDKMIRRHPHVFGDQSAKTAADVHAHWDAVKAKEKPQRTLLEETAGLPALLQAKKIQTKVSREGFDWPDATGPLSKIKEEIDEVAAEMNRVEIDRKKLNEELGDLLFSVVNLIRKVGLDPEISLTEASQKFVKRYTAMKTLSNDHHQTPFKELTLDEMSLLWDQTKATLGQE